MALKRKNPFVKIRIESEAAVRALVERAVSVYGVYELWGEGETEEQLMEALKKYLAENEEARERVEKRTFKLKMTGYNRSYSREMQIKKFESLGWMGWGRNAEMKTPEEMYELVEVVSAHAHHEDPFWKTYFMRLIATGARHLIDKYSLKKRKYLGTTSMETEISFFSSNQALAAPGKLIFDPFVGTGSLIITSAVQGAFVLGADIDYEVLTGKKQQGKSVRANFEAYGLVDQLVDLVQFDTSKHSTFRSNDPFLDAIVCDPPYGIRAGAKKVGVRPRTVAKHEKAGTKIGPIHTNPSDPGWLPHTPQYVPYSVPDVLADLLDFAARSLKLHGRLVYWLPTSVDFVASDLPLHPCFSLVANSEQRLTLYFSRRLITLEKCKEFEEGKDFAFVPAPLDATLSNLSVAAFAAGPYTQDLAAASSSSPAHANIAAKVTKQMSRKDDRLTSDSPAADVQAQLPRPTGAELKKRRKAERKAARKATEAEMEAKGSANTSLSPSPSQDAPKDSSTQ